MTAADFSKSQAEMWAQRVAEAEAALCHTTDPRALRAAIAAHEQHEADWQANRRTDAYAKLEAQAQRQAARQETMAQRAAEQRAADQRDVHQRDAERWAAAIAREHHGTLLALERELRAQYQQAWQDVLVDRSNDASLTWRRVGDALRQVRAASIRAGKERAAAQRFAAAQKAAAVAAGIRAAGEAGRRAAHKQAEAARIDYRETLHNGAWRGWGGLSQQDRAERVAAPDWSTDIDDQDEWTEHVIAAHLDLIPASLLALSPRMGHYYGHADYGDARE